MTPPFILWVGDDVHAADAVGGKGRGLGMLVEAGLRVPEAFVVTTAAFRAAVTGELADDIAGRIGALPADADVTTLDEVSAAVRAALVDGTDGHPADAELRAAYADLARRIDQAEPAVAVRSSSAAEDAADRSFAGEHDTYLWVHGADEVSAAVRRCWASLYTSRAISYRARHAGADVEQDAMAVVVQRMVDARSAGVFMTLNPINGDRSKVVIESVWGLGEPLVSGTADPDRFMLDKITGDVLERTVVTKPTRAVRHPDTGRGIADVDVAAEDRTSPSLTKDELSELLEFARAVEAFAGAPQDGEFAVAEDGVYLVQARPETVWSSKPVKSVSTGTGADPMAHILRTLTTGAAPTDRTD